MWTILKFKSNRKYTTVQHGALIKYKSLERSLILCGKLIRNLKESL